MRKTTMLAWVLMSSTSQDGGESQPGACGNSVCDAGENVFSCDSDCSAGAADDWSLEIEECADATDQSSMNETLAAAVDLETSYHEMIACGGLLFDMTLALVDVLLDLTLGVITEQPTGFSWTGDGYMSTPDPATEMTVTFRYGDDFEVGAEDDVVNHDLFDADNYLVDPTVGLDLGAGETLLYFEGTGPLVELLGFGPRPSSPIRIGLDDVNALGGEFGRLKLQSEVQVDTSSGNTAVTYHIGVGPKRLNPLLGQGEIAMDHLGTTATRGDIDLVTTSWNITFVDGSIAALRGDTSLEATGGAFDYDVDFVYDDATWADVSVQCAQP